MPERDTATQPLHDLLSAFGLLTRLPLPQTTRHRANAAWCWPLVGLGVGAVALGIGWLGLQAGVAPGTAAALTMGAGVMVTGALHQDGLADTADGLFGGWTPERRLDIMKDSHIGSYGTLALIIVSLALWSALGGLIAAGDWVAIGAAAALSRAPMAVTMAALPNARKAGLSSSVGRPSWGGRGHCGGAGRADLRGADTRPAANLCHGGGLRCGQPVGGGDGTAQDRGPDRRYLGGNTAIVTGGSPDRGPNVKGGPCGPPLSDTGTL